MEHREVVVAVVQGEVEEQQLRAFLEAHGVSTRVEGEALRKTHAFVLDGLGEVRILVPAEQAGEARDLIARVEAGELALDAGAEP
jgi:hypothetical protein